MPNKYQRQASANRGNWSEESLKAAIVALKNGEMSVNSNVSRTPTKNDVPDLTPTRILMEISPVPQKVIEVRKRAKQVGTLLTSEEHIQMRKSKEDMKNAKTLKSITKNVNKENKTEKKDNKIDKKENKTEKDKNTVLTSAPRKRKSLRRISDSSDDEEQPVLCDSSSEEGGGREEDNCVGCGENYFETHLIEDWLQCIICQLWVHENCTEFDNMCSKCGQRKKKELKLKNGTVKKEKQ